MLRLSVTGTIHNISLTLTRRLPLGPVCRVHDARVDQRIFDLAPLGYHLIVHAPQQGRVLDTLEHEEAISVEVVEGDEEGLRGELAGFELF